MATFNQLMTDGFGVVTVMDVCVLTADYSKDVSCCHGDADSALTPSDFTWGKSKIDTLKIANINQEGPTKTITGGRNANTLIKYGKTTTIEMQDALASADILEEFFGCEVHKTGSTTQTISSIAVTDKFPGPIALQGKTFFINQKTGEQVPVYIFIPQFLPDAILNLTQDAEGDAAVFDLNGSVNLTRISDGAESNPYIREVFYEISDQPFVTCTG